DDPARIEIEAEADAAAMLGEMLDGQAEPARTGRAKHEPVGALGEIRVGERFAEHLVIDPVVVADDPALGDAGGAAGFEDVGRLVPEFLGEPAAHGAAAQPIVFEETELLEVLEALDV